MPQTGEAIHWAKGVWRHLDLSASRENVVKDDRLHRRHSQKEKKSDFGVSFPDFPGCVTAGRSIEEARVMAQEALNGHAALLAEEGIALPVPSVLDHVVKDADFSDAVAYFIVQVDAPRVEPVRFNASMDANLLSRIDERARATGMTRSGFLAEAARKQLAGRR